MVSQRTKELLGVVLKLRKEHRRWTADDEAQYAPDSYWRICRQCCEAWQQGEIPAELRALGRRVDALAAQLEAFDAQDPQPQDPGGRFWGAQEGVFNILENPGRKLPPLETVAQLTEQKVSDAQICKIYGFADKYGRPDFAALAKEREAPGSVTKGGGWVDPRMKDLEGEVGYALADLIESLGGFEPSGDTEADLRDAFDRGREPGEVAKALGLPFAEVVEKFSAWAGVAPRGRGRPPKAAAVASAAE